MLKANGSPPSAVAAPAIPCLLRQPPAFFPLPRRRPLVWPLRSTATSTCEPPASINVKGVTKRRSEFLDIEFKVRDYELDQFGVVNNAVYASYSQHALKEFLETIGIHLDFGNGHVVALREFSIKFLAPLSTGDKFVVKVRMSGLSAAQMYFEDFFYKLPDQEPIAEAKGSAVWLDKNYRPARIPSEIRSKLLSWQGQTYPCRD